MTKPTLPSISVLMPVYRPHPVYFLESVNSILKQTFADFELIIVEDPSECSAEVLLSQVSDDRIRFYRNSSRTSLVARRNSSIELAEGRYLAFMDADDVSESHRLEVQFEFLERHQDVDLLGSQLLVIDSSGDVQGFRSFPTHHDDIVHAMQSVVPISQPSVMVRRHVITEIGGYTWHAFPVAEDYELWTKMALSGIRLANYPEPLLRYRCHPGQAKAMHLRDTIRAVIAVKKQFWRARMNWKAKLRLFGEQALLWLPPRLVWKLIYLAQYRDRLPAKHLCRETEADDHVNAMAIAVEMSHHENAERFVDNSTEVSVTQS